MLEIETSSTSFELLERSIFSLNEKKELNLKFRKIQNQTDIIKIPNEHLIKEWNEYLSSFNNDEKLLNEIDEIYDSLMKSKEKANENIINNSLYDLNRLKSYVIRNNKYIKTNVIVVNGNGATGKTHILTKLNKKIIDNDLPSLIIYGHLHKNKESLINYLNGYFKTADFFEEYKRSFNYLDFKPVIIFDALNEYRNNDQRELAQTLIHCAQKYDLKLIISYRIEDVKTEIIDLFKEYPYINIYGFENEMEAKIKFSNHFEIDINEFLEIDFNSNPLMMILFSRSYKEGSVKKGLRGHVSANYFFENYFKFISKQIIKEYQIKHNTNNKLVNQELFRDHITKPVIEIMVEQNDLSVTEKQIIDVIDNLDININSNQLADILVSYNLFERFYDYHNSQHRYKLSFQKFSDFLITRYILNNKPNDLTYKEYFSSDDIIKYLNDNQTVVSSLVDEISSRTKGETELYEVINNKKINNFVNLYIIGVSTRSKKSFNNKFKKKFLKFVRKNKLELDNFYYYRMLYSVMLIPYHPLNISNFLRYKIKRALGSKSEYNYYDFFDGRYADNERIINLLKIPYFDEYDKFNMIFKKNLSLLMLYLLGLSNREVRDKASKSLYVLVEKDNNLLNVLLEESIKIKDQYIIERLLLIIETLLHTFDIENSLKLNIEKYIIRKFNKRKISNIRISFFLDNIIKKINIDGKKFNYKKRNLKLFNNSPIINEKKITFGKKHNMVWFSIGSFIGDFLHKLVKPKIAQFTFKRDEKTINSKVNRLLRKFTKEDFLIYNNIISFNSGYDDYRQMIEYLMEGKPFVESEKTVLEKQFSEKGKNIYSSINEIKNHYQLEQIPEDSIVSTLVEKMLKLGFSEQLSLFDERYHKHRYDYSRHNHRHERVGKKYQWIAFLELLGECYNTLEINGYTDYYSLLYLDIDLNQNKKSSKKQYAFNDVFDKRIQELNIDFSKDDFETNYDNLNIANSLIDIDFNGDKYVSLSMSFNLIDDTLKKELYYSHEIYDIKEEYKEVIKDINFSSNYIYDLRIVDVFNKINIKRIEEDESESYYNSLHISLYLENEYDYSNYGLTDDDKNPSYLLPINNIIDQLNLTYEFDGIFYDTEGNVALIQSPFESDNSYLFIRKDLLFKLFNKLYIKAFSNKRITINKELSLGSEYWQDYEMNDKTLKLLNTLKQ